MQSFDINTAEIDHHRADLKPNLSLSNLDPEQVGILLTHIDYSEFSVAFVNARVCGSNLKDLEINEELKELNIIMPSLKFKSFLRHVQEVDTCISPNFTHVSSSFVTTTV